MKNQVVSVINASIANDTKAEDTYNRLKAALLPLDGKKCSSKAVQSVIAELGGSMRVIAGMTNVVLDGMNYLISYTADVSIATLENQTWCQESAHGRIAKCNALLADENWLNEVSNAIESYNKAVALLNGISNMNPIKHDLKRLLEVVK
jgi:hypothetical protein